MTRFWFLISGIDVRSGGNQLPHSRTRFIQAEIPLRLEIQEHGLSVEKSHQHVRRHVGTIHKGHHASSSSAETRGAEFFCVGGREALAPLLYRYSTEDSCRAPRELLVQALLT